MKVTIEQNGFKCTVEDEKAENIYDVVELVSYALKGIGFSEETISKVIKEIEWE